MAKSEKPDRTPDRLADLDRRIAAARDAKNPAPRANKDKYAAMSLGWRMVIELVLSIVIGGAMGWGLDSLLGTLPVFLIVMVLLGFAAGVRTMMLSAREMQIKAAEAATDTPPSGAGNDAASGPQHDERA